jgi:hypothetical protein
VPSGLLVAVRSCGTLGKVGIPDEKRSATWMRGPLGALAKAIGIVGLAAVAVVGCVAVVRDSLTYDPPPNAEAKRREQILIALQPTTLPAEGLRFIADYSDAGRKTGQGDFELGQPVHVGRQYAFTGEPVASCHAVVDTLVRKGWTVTGPHEGCDRMQKSPPDPEFDRAGSESIYVDLTFQCRGFKVKSLLSLRMDATDDPPQEIELTLEADYPEHADPDPYVSTEPTNPAPVRCR